MKTLSRLYMFLIIFFLYAPLLVMVFFSFNSSNSTAIFEGFSLQWYGELFGDAQTTTALSNTLMLAVSSAVIATLFGTITAVGLYYTKNNLIKKASMTVTNIPMMAPDIVTGISLMLLFIFVGRWLSLKNALGFGTLLIAHVTFNLPYVILSVLPKLKQTDKFLYEAAQDLGCTPVRAFWHAVLPNITSGIVTGFIMAFTLSLDDFVISYFTTGAEFQTLPIRIFSMTKKRVTPDMYALSTIIFIAVLLLLVLLNIAQSRSENKSRRKK